MASNHGEKRHSTTAEDVKSKILQRIADEIGTQADADTPAEIDSDMSFPVAAAGKKPYTKGYEKTYVKSGFAKGYGKDYGKQPYAKGYEKTYVKSGFIKGYGKDYGKHGKRQS
jgi:hypothetical protein